MNTDLLKEIGLTESEIKVYLALLKLGSSKKGAIVKEAGITSSKIYEVMDKLIEKGLASYVVKDKVKHFNAAPISRIKDYLIEKEKKLREQEKELESLLPQLGIKKNYEKGTDAEIYRGWKGMKTVYNDLLNSLKPGEEYFVFGASKGTDTEKVKSFYSWFSYEVIKKKLKSNIIFNTEAKGNIPEAKKTGKVKYLDQTTPAEILVYKNKTVIVLLEEEPMAILIKGESVAKSFKAYFGVMWIVAKR